ncbi:YceD family protein [Parvularcula dongshanensis]|uniref:Uncharacterized metal-binding protein YceD (DUF177 family) n=1 Tax=Parvularcula dongshanensis TaxID=1173995 RepID=A0A840I5X8_9PROT|nr:DUF177 domain-containing protein [Parvularcula dongshanensis]MBB4659673.1 uncharacterized metal-binding protein YceD (DUF177 family) [Parvularcula dongshanensis]
MTSPYKSFTRRIETAKLAAGQPFAVELTMEEADREALAKAFGLPGVEALSGEATAARTGGLIEVEGVVRARLTRQCVVSLEEMSEVIEEPFLVTYTEDAGEIEEGEFEADLEAPEPVEGGAIDLGDVLLEQLVLAIDPHPRKDGAVPPADPGAGGRITPFDVLAKLKEEG